MRSSVYFVRAKKKGTYISCATAHLCCLDSIVTLKMVSMSAIARLQLVTVTVGQFHLVEMLSRRGSTYKECNNNIIIITNVFIFRGLHIKQIY